METRKKIGEALPERVLRRRLGLLAIRRASVGQSNGIIDLTGQTGTGRIAPEWTAEGFDPHSALEMTDAIANLDRPHAQQSN